MSAAVYESKLHELAYGKIKVWIIDRRAVLTFLNKRYPRKKSCNEDVRYWPN